jgi:hypothetical protein
MRSRVAMDAGVIVESGSVAGSSCIRNTLRHHQTLRTGSRTDWTNGVMILLLILGCILRLTFRATPPMRCWARVLKPGGLQHLADVTASKYSQCSPYWR